MTLFRTSFWNGIAVTVRLGTALVLNKILAIYVGPAGYAIIGQFQNGVTIALTFATGAVGTGVTKYTAEYCDDEARQRSLWATAGTMTLIASLASAAAIAVFRYPLARFFLKNEQFSGIFLWLAGALVFIGFNALLLAILNGRKELRRFVISNIAGSLIGLATTGILAWRFGLHGALVALSFSQGIVFFVTLQQTLTAPWFRMRHLFGRIDREHLKNLGGFILMAATTAIVGPAVLILIRNHLAAEYGFAYAGYWDAMWRISALYLTLVTTTLSLYYLPRISEIRSWTELRSEIVSAYRLILPFVAVLSLTIYLLRDLVVRLLFTAEFEPMRQLFAWQLAGDVVKIGSWLLAFVMLGKAMTKLYIATEIIFGLLFWGSTIVLTRWIGFTGVAAAHFLTYAAYMVTMYLLVFRAGEARRPRA